MIYIDPPYNTGKDFLYPDDYAESRDEYLEKSNQVDDEGNRMVANTDANGRFHSDWLSMMYSRLKLARNLLRDDGVIFISIDDHEVHNLRKICDEIFGAGNFVEEFINRSNPRGNQAKKFTASEHEYVLVFARNKSLINPLGQIKAEDEFTKKDSNGSYTEIGLRKRGAGSRREDAPNQFYPIYYDVLRNEISLDRIDNSIEILPKLSDGSDGRWRWSFKSVDLKKDKLIVRRVKGRKAEDYDVFEKKYFTGQQIKKQKSIIYEKGVNNENATEEVSKLFQGMKFFDFPKPVFTIKKLVEICNFNDGIVLDFFAGSATTAHAVMKLNAEDGGNRKFILVQLPEKCDEKSEAFKEGYKTIAEISKERIRRAGKKIKEENPETTKDLDIGFRVLKVDTSNMKDTYYKPKEINQQQIAGLISNIKEDRTDEDLLFQVMLDSGVQLDLEITTEEIMGKKVYFVAANSLCACFETNLPEGLFSELAKREPVTLVLKDSSFVNNDALKTNVEQIFRQLSPETELKVI